MSVVIDMVAHHVFLEHSAYVSQLWGLGSVYCALLCPSLGILLSLRDLPHPNVVSPPTRPHLVSG